MTYLSCLEMLKGYLCSLLCPDMLVTVEMLLLQCGKQYKINKFSLLYNSKSDWRILRKLYSTVKIIILIYMHAYKLAGKVSAHR